MSVSGPNLVLPPQSLVHSQTWLPDPFGSLDFDTIPQTVDPITGELRSIASPIRLQQGNGYLGYVHLVLNHGKKIEHYYKGMDPLTYVSIVSKNYSRIYLQKDRSLFLLKFNGVVKSAVVAKFNRQNEDCYRVITAYPLERLPDFKGRGATLIWER